MLMFAAKGITAACDGADTECPLNAECTASTCSCKSGYTAASSNTQCNSMYAQCVRACSVFMSAFCMCVQYIYLQLICARSLYVQCLCVYSVCLVSLSVPVRVCVYTLCVQSTCRKCVHAVSQSTEVDFSCSIFVFICMYSLSVGIVCVHRHSVPVCTVCYVHNVSVYIVYRCSVDLSE